MTNEKAIQELRWIKEGSVLNQEARGALDMAIMALQVQDRLQDIEYMCRLSGGADYFYAFRAISEKVKNSKQEVDTPTGTVNTPTGTTNTPTDYISKEIAIRIINDIDTWQAGWRHTAIGAVQAFSSAQPETCDTCKHGYFGDEQCNSCRVRFTSHYERRTDD